MPRVLAPFLGLAPRFVARLKPTLDASTTCQLHRRLGEYPLSNWLALYTRLISLEELGGDCGRLAGGLSEELDVSCAFQVRQAGEGSKRAPRRSRTTLGKAELIGARARCPRCLCQHA
jgi:hypothetical protein